MKLSGILFVEILQRNGFRMPWAPPTPCFFITDLAEADIVHLPEAFALAHPKVILSFNARGMAEAGCKIQGHQVYLLCPFCSA